MLTVHTLASGSEGNCLLLSGGGVHLLVDAGISARRITVDYRFDCLGASVGVLTDTGCVTSEAETALRGVRLLVLESNHDADWLMSGPYPYYLKQRIAGRLGHLSNEDAAAFAHRLAEQGTRRFVLAHLSRENNTPARALQVMETALAGLNVLVDVAPRGELSACYEAEVTLCSV